MKSNEMKSNRGAFNVYKQSQQIITLYIIKDIHCKLLSFHFTLKRSFLMKSDSLTLGTFTVNRDLKFSESAQMLSRYALYSIMMSTNCWPSYFQCSQRFATFPVLSQLILQTKCNKRYSTGYKFYSNLLFSI